MTNGFIKDGKFHPITTYKPVRKKRNKTIEPTGVRIRKKVQTKAQIKKEIEDVVPESILQQEVKGIQREQRVEEKIPKDLKNVIKDIDAVEWEDVAKSKIKSIKEEKFEGMPVVTVKFENGEEWFEFQSFQDEKKFIRQNFEKQVNDGKFDNDSELQNHLLLPNVTKFEKEIDSNKEKIDDFNFRPIRELSKRNIGIKQALNRGLIFRSTETLIEHFEEEGKLLPVDHPEIDGYVDLINGVGFFKTK